MRTLTLAAIGCLALVGVAFAADLAANGSKARHAKIILAFGTMYGVDGPFVGDANPIRGVIGDELPWAIDSFIKATIELPNPWVAPIIMVLAGSEEKWFAVTGFEAEEEEDEAKVCPPARDSWCGLRVPCDLSTILSA